MVSRGVVLGVSRGGGLESPAITGEVPNSNPQLPECQRRDTGQKLRQRRQQTSPTAMLP